MKIKNIFKKTKKIVVEANIQKLEKNQLEKVAGGLSTAQFNPKEYSISK